MSDHAIDPATDAFVAHRNLLFTVACELLGSAPDAEDVLRETWLGSVTVAVNQVRDPRVCLVRIVTRRAINRLRAVRRNRETHVGPWLPEPQATSQDVLQDVELAERVSMAVMPVLETLSPTERAVFVLREVFALGYDEIAAAVDRRPDAVRQIALRARQPRQVVSAAETRAALESCQHAVETGSRQELLDVLARDVVLIADGGGVRQAVLRPLTGAERVGRMILGALDTHAHAFGADVTVINDTPALAVTIDGELDGVMACRVGDGRITGLYYVRNPQKRVRRPCSPCAEPHQGRRESESHG